MSHPRLRRPSLRLRRPSSPARAVYGCTGLHSLREPSSAVWAVLGCVVPSSAAWAVLGPCVSRPRACVSRPEPASVLRLRGCFPLPPCAPSSPNCNANSPRAPTCPCPCKASWGCCCCSILTCALRRRWRCEKRTGDGMHPVEASCSQVPRRYCAERRRVARLCPAPWVIPCTPSPLWKNKSSWGAGWGW